jgi:hypothetical protein
MNAFVVSQFSHLEYNSMWSIGDLKQTQTIIDNFINKKKITSKNTIYLNYHDGGSYTHNIYLIKLAAKLHFWKKLCDCEDLPMADRPSCYLLILRLFFSFNFMKPSFIMMSGDNNIRNLHNVFKCNGYSYWAYSIDALIEMRKIQNFSYYNLNIRRNKTAPTHSVPRGGKNSLTF